MNPPQQRVTAVLLVVFFLLFYVATSPKGPYPACAPYPESVLSKYSDLSYPLRTPDLAIDALLRVYHAGTFQGIVLCQRNRPPKLLAIPGGYVEYGERVEDAARREVLEETSLIVGNGSDLQQWRVFGDPMRDKRRHTVSVVFDITIWDQTPKAGDDVKHCDVYRIHDIPTDPSLFAFDHYTVLKNYIAYLRRLGAIKL